MSAIAGAGWGCGSAMAKVARVAAMMAMKKVFILMLGGFALGRF